MVSSLLEKDKSLLRRRLRQAVKRIGLSKRRKKSSRIIRRLLGAAVFKNSRNIMTYVALSDEVDTRELILKALALRKNVYAPRIFKKRKEIGIFQIRHPRKDLRKGTYGIQEPGALSFHQGNPARLDLVIVPGLGFDRRGGRLGRGGGYFDRFLLKTNRARKIGLAFREQMVRKIPIGSHDIRVDRVITD